MSRRVPLTAIAAELRRQRDGLEALNVQPHDVQLARAQLLIAQATNLVAEVADREPITVRFAATSGEGR